MPDDDRIDYSVPPMSGQVRATDRPGALVVLEKPTGSIAMGQLAEKVVFICFVGETPLDLAERCVRRLKRMLARGSDFALFIDAHAPEGGNVESRNEIVRGIVSSRHRLSALVVLVRTEFVKLSATALGSAFGENAIVTSNPVEFDELLIDAAPYAYEALRTTNCVTAGPSSLPPLQIIRSA